MKLGQFATIVGALPRWVQNAYQVLQLDPGYDEERAKLLGLARQLHEALGIPLVESWPLAQEALAAWPDQEIWRCEDTAGVVTLEVDVRRYLSNYAVRLSLARSSYGGTKRGRPRKGRKGGVAEARAYGIDIGLLREALERTPAERLRRLEDDVAFVQALRVAEP
jgi:hypothetical protein